MPRQFTLPNTPGANLWAGIKNFANRGGFVSGLNPTQTGKIWYVNGNQNADADDRRGPVGSDGNNGSSPNTPFATIARAFEFVDSYDVIVVQGLIREQVTAPLLVHDVTIVGAANLPRQATSGGIANGGGATWLAPTSPTALTPLLTLLEQGWTVANIMFGTVASTPAIRLKRQESAAFPDASHASILGCMFATQGLATEHGIGSESLFHRVIKECFFLGLTGTAILGESVSIATPSSNVIDGCMFRECVNAIDWPMNYGVISNNRFKDITTKRIDINVGADNYVGINFVDSTQANISIAGGFTGNASDIWRNYSSDIAALTVGVPA